MKPVYCHTCYVTFVFNLEFKRNQPRERLCTLTQLQNNIQTVATRYLLWLICLHLNLLSLFHHPLSNFFETKRGLRNSWFVCSLNEATAQKHQDCRHFSNLDFDRAVHPWFVFWQSNLLPPFCRTSATCLRNARSLQVLSSPLATLAFLTLNILFHSRSQQCPFNLPSHLLRLQLESINCSKYYYAIKWNYVRQVLNIFCCFCSI